jgi:enoyl-CoA hydratase
MNRWEQFKLIQIELEPPLARITLNRPEKLNALNQALLRELMMALPSVLTGTGVRALVLTGAGEKAFAAGADISELAELEPATAQALSQRGSGFMHALEHLPVPVIAAINGFALGGGLELALACTVRIASENAKLGQPEVKLGIIPGYGGTQRLARIVGESRALEMILTGEPIPASEALRIGLVSRVVPQAELLATADAIARQIASNAPQAVRWAKQAVQTGASLPIEAGSQLESSLFSLCTGTADMKEGTRAFLEKRAPVFQGK